MVEAPWNGCIASAAAKSREWFRRTQLPLMPWSSQAQGFFAGLAAPGKLDNKDLVRCWYADDNFERLKRATELAGKRGCIPTNIALAWVLNQPFPVFPLVGPRALHEVTTTMDALDISLTPEEMAWLNLEG
jgi:aryl-alcohol dehydrogenase-like predicted oxidoreductase